MTELQSEFNKVDDSPKDLTLLSVRVRSSQRQKIEELSEISGCSLAEAARRVLDEGLESRGEA
ncbi:MAG: hypothetical protein ABEJ83_05705 [Candidatus Nanohaloarchaea archaeon]